MLHLHHGAIDRDDPHPGARRRIRTGRGPFAIADPVIRLVGTIDLTVKDFVGAQMALASMGASDFDMMTVSDFNLM